ncbi:MAG: class I SAM-dependent methyltransferase [Saprospiraceae bacterium]|nr:class I SAM-dependent methyltransferase [Bacteroidia bacterium]NNE15314.1 class I SAM-dependent methyltransferase [Saprospiraceae bacterium]NNL93958.1 class I SAM-dependent methyltransferase [Saprospiraceae bacterium]
MKINEAYDQWSVQYDTNKNKTRDLEGQVMRELLEGRHFNKTLEIGCGTGKNTEWLGDNSTHITGVDFSEKMLEVARKKIKSDKVSFIQADITKSWTFENQSFDLITFSLVLEHIESLSDIFQNVSNYLTPNGIVYIGELHPFKQYHGSKARFEGESGVFELECYTHHISEFINEADAIGLKMVHLGEYFDEGETPTIPRILGLLFNKK